MTGIVSKLAALASQARMVAARHRARGEDKLAEEMDACAEDYEAAAERAKSGRLHFIGAMRKSNRRRTEAA